MHTFVYPSDVPPDAEVSVAADGSFVETSSGPTAIELKRRYDHEYGVGKEVRSPYAITALINQHGKQMYRVGLRESVSEMPDEIPKERKRRSTYPRKLRKTRSMEAVSQPSRGIRGHSQSVTSADVRSFVHRDVFAEVMDWEPISERSLILQPFGSQIEFDPPARPSAIGRLREMQSFESGLTARQDEPEIRRLPSAIHLSAIAGPSPETAIHSRYATDIFDILQTYKGLPLHFDKLLSHSTTVRMSLDNEAAPKDDPRFVIWGQWASERLLIAATIERWIAQLTSLLNYDELLVFFLTYRTYISPVDLCHLLICRFHWGLQSIGSVTDDKVRRIVRTRTFVAFRYWLLTFFVVDFLPNRDLRLLVANWLNALRRDIILEKHADGVITVKKLIKLVKDLKKSHTSPKPSITASETRSRSTTTTSSSSSTSSKLPKEESLFGEKFTEATRKDADDSDVDLDFEALGETPSSLPSASLILPSTPATATAAGITTPTTGTVPHSASLPIHHSPLSRVFVKTIGQLGRWKRVLNNRGTSMVVGGGRTGSGTTTSSTLGSTNVSAFELEGPESEVVAEGKVVEVVPASEEPISPAEVTTPTPTPSEPPPEYTQDLDATNDSSDSSDDYEQRNPTSPEITVQVVSIASSSRSSSQSGSRSRSIRRRSSMSSRSSSDDSLGQPLSGPAFQSPWGFDVVSIDELDLSDSSSEAHVGPRLPPGLRRQPRRLPRAFEFAPRPESVSSMGIHTRSSSVNSLSEGEDISLGGGIQQWQMNALVDSLSEEEDDGNGDRDDALRRLEGQINPQRQREKRDKVDGWVRSIRMRMVRGEYEDERPRFLDDEDEDADAEGEGEPAEGAGTPEIVVTEEDDDSVSVSIVSSPPRDGAKPAPEDAVPLEILQSRVAPNEDPSPIPPPHNSLSDPVPSVSSHKSRYQSWILSPRSSLLAQHFAMIDRELFLGLKFEQLVLTDDWMNVSQNLDVLDWAQYLKDRARWKAEGRFQEKTSAFAAVRARFNLMVGFTVTEVVLSQPPERVGVFGKFLRVAWKSYCLQSFNTLVAIITALKSDWVTLAMRRHWHKLGMWESRIFTDFKQWCTAEGGFKHIRQTVDALVDAKPLDVGSHAPSVVSGASTSEKSRAAANSEIGCVPFIGIFLTQLHHHNRLPDLIDPTSPNEAVIVDPNTGNFEKPAHPEVFSTLAPLPSPMDLEPLINVHKQRMIAGVIKSLVASQHLASRVNFSVDKKLFQKCLRLRALDADSLQRAVNID